MKKILGILIVLFAAILIYNSKKDYYKINVDFYNKDLNGIVTEIKKGRGTKVYLNESYYFYLDQLEDPFLRVGDSISKVKTGIQVFEKSNGPFKYMATTKVIKPKDNYFEFFFGF